MRSNLAHCIDLAHHHKPVHALADLFDPLDEIADGDNMRRCDCYNGQRCHHPHGMLGNTAYFHDPTLHINEHWALAVAHQGRFAKRQYALAFWRKDDGIRTLARIKFDRLHEHCAAVANAHARQPAIKIGSERCVES